MSFLKDFKEDLSLAVSELLPQDIKEEENAAQAETPLAKEAKEEQPVQEKPQKGKSDEQKGKEKNRQKYSGKKNLKAGGELTDEKPVIEKPAVEETPVEEPVPQIKEANQEPVVVEPVAEEPVVEELVLKEPVLKEVNKDYEEKQEKNIEVVEAEKTMDEMTTGNLEKETEDISMDRMNVMAEMQMETLVTDDKKDQKKSDEVATITEGTRIHGDIESDGSLEILGTITGNVTCNGKLTITGTIIGDSSADEIYADSAKIEGEINSAGAVKIGLGSVILGNVNATSAVIAGAIRGDIDVHGPVIVDTSAVVMGNIKSRSVQINNGAVIEGFCSQCYSDVSVKNFFEENKPSDQKK